MQRQSKLFVASEGAGQRYFNKKISGIRRQIGACQAQVMQGKDIRSNRDWMLTLEAKISVLRDRVLVLGQY